MSKKRFVVLPLLSALIIIGLLIGGGLAIYRGGWSHGYMMGQLAVGGDGGAAVPYAPYGFGYPPGAYGFAPFLCGVGLLFKIGLILLLLVVIGKFLRFRAWKMAGRRWAMADGPKGEHWAKYGHWPHGPMPPGCWGWEESPEEKPEETEAEPDAETGTTEV